VSFGWNTIAGVVRLFEIQVARLDPPPDGRAYLFLSRESKIPDGTKTSGKYLFCRLRVGLTKGSEGAIESFLGSSSSSAYDIYFSTKIKTRTTYSEMRWYRLHKPSAILVTCSFSCDPYGVYLRHNLQQLLCCQPVQLPARVLYQICQTPKYWFFLGFPARHKNIYCFKDQFHISHIRRVHDATFIFGTLCCTYVKRVSPNPTLGHHTNRHTLTRDSSPASLHVTHRFGMQMLVFVS